MKVKRAKNQVVFLQLHTTYTVKMDMLYLIKKIVSTDYKQYY